MSENIKVDVDLKLKSVKVEERRLKQNSFKLSFESRSVRNFSNVGDCSMQKVVYRKSSFAEFDMCRWSLIFAGTGRAHTSTVLTA